jgi:hypothetical protein
MKLPRKIKKKYKKIRGGDIGGFCYGASLSDKPQKINGQKKYVTKVCQFYSKGGTTCKLLNIYTKNNEVLDACFSDQTAICAMESKKVREFLKTNLKNYLK